MIDRANVLGEVGRWILLLLGDKDCPYRDRWPLRLSLLLLGWLLRLVPLPILLLLMLVL